MPTNHGFHTDFDYSRYPEPLRIAIRKIAAQLYVTKSFRSIEIGNSQYFAIIARPTDEYSIYINTDREVLFVFSQYETFEIRTLEAFDEFYSLLESSRIDRSIRFLVSGDDRIEAIVKHYLDQYPEYPIIIPITLKALVEGGKSSILEAIRRNYLLRDLFGYSNPLREETFFFGRQFVVASVLDSAKSGQSSSLFGLRKSGKTSAIYAIQRKARGLSFNVAVIDCQDPAVHARQYDTLLSYVILEVRRSFGQKKIAPQLGATAEEVSENFVMHMNNAVGNAKNNILLIFDEIENISPETAASTHWREGHHTLLFWQIIRSYIQAHAKGRLALCLVGTSPRILELPRINDVANPIYLFAQKQFIPNLTFDETREMVERLGYLMGLEFPPEIVSELQRVFGGHPFFTRQVCSKIHQIASLDRPLVVSQNLLDRAKRDFQGQLEAYLRDIIKQLKDDYPEEFEVIRAVVEGDRRDLIEYGKEAPELIDHLIGYGLVARIGDDFDIKVNAIKDALRHLIGTEGVEDRWAEISRRRNLIESSIRLELFHWSKGLESAVWSEILNGNLTNSRLNGLHSTEPRILFSSRESPLYLSDLLMLLKDERVLPYLGERRTYVVGKLDIINNARKDAHAIVVADHQMISIRAAFDLLETEFSGP
jgi:hypothetical protein